MSRPNSKPDTPATFSRAEAKRIREMVLSAGTIPTCPRCGEALELRSPTTVHGELIRQVHCARCRRTLVVKEPRG